MKNLVQKIYAVFAIVIVLLILLVNLTFELNITKSRTKTGCQIINTYEYDKRKDASAPAGVVEEYRFVLNEIEGAYTELMFYSIHQNVEIYLGEERIYSMRAKHNNLFGSTPGCVWNDVVLSSADADRPICIRIYPVYKAVTGLQPDFYFGEKAAVCKRIILRDTPIAVFSLISIVIGFYFVFYIIFNYKNSELDKNILMLGCFAVEVGLWKLADLPMVNLFFPNAGGAYLIPILLLQLVSVPALLFTKDLIGMQDKRIWYIPCFASFTVMTLTILLQFTGLADFRATLWMTHGVMLAAGLIIAYMVYLEVRAKGLNEKLRRNVKYMMFCLFGLVIDLVTYYLSSGKYATSAGMIGFVVYIVAAGVFFMRDNRDLLDEGMRARNYERMAYHDQLTGLFNRTALTAYIEAVDFSPERCIVAICDLNDLKKCNDVLGHEMGDVYIKECADVIKSVFGDVGKCYRTGGDEFCVLIENISLSVCKQRVQLLHNMIKKRNERYPDIKMGIACGYEVYDKRIDYDINDTTRRADKNMYREKFSMKEKKV